MQVRRAFRRGRGEVGPVGGLAEGFGGSVCERRCTGRRSKKPTGQPVSSKPNVFASSFYEVARRHVGSRGENVWVVGGVSSGWHLCAGDGAVVRWCGSATVR